MIGTPPDSWASAITYASLEMLAQAIGRVGPDRGAVAAELSTGSFDTVIGEVKLQDNQLRDLWLVGQWQGDKFVGIAPSDRHGAEPAIIPKPNWSPFAISIRRPLPATRNSGDQVSQPTPVPTRC